MQTSGCGAKRRRTAAFAGGAPQHVLLDLNAPFDVRRRVAQLKV